MIYGLNTHRVNVIVVIKLLSAVFVLNLGSKLMEKVRWFVYEIDPTVHPDMFERLKLSSSSDSAKQALSTFYQENTHAYEGHDPISGTPYYVFKSWDTVFLVSVSRMKVKGEKRTFECWG